MSVSRCMRPANFGPVADAQLHHFSDASENGYGTVSYLRQTNNDGRIHCAFMMGRARVAPTKTTTIPRMELTAAVLAVNTDNMLRRELSMELRDSTFWTDSTTVLRYIENETLRFKTFVANRVAAIRDATNGSMSVLLSTLPTVPPGGSHLPSSWRSLAGFMVQLSW